MTTPTTQTHSLKIEDAPLNRLVIWVTVFTVGGMVTDGFILGHIGVALSLATPELGLDALWLGLIAASTLVGILVGSPFGGQLSDRFGRKRLLMVTFILLTIGALAHLLVADPLTLVIIRFLMGVVIGFEYAVGAALLSELAPTKKRGVLLAMLNAGWIVGFVGGFVSAYALRASGASWQIIFASAAIPAFIVFLLRIGSPESPRWLVTAGRPDEAQAVVTKYYGSEYGLGGLAAETNETKESSSIRTLFTPEYRTRTLFAGIFWACQVIPLFALTIFLPQVFEALGIEGELGAEMLVNSMLLVGAVAGIVAIRYFTRRGFTIWSFVIVAIALVFMALAGVLPVIVALIAFAAFVLVGSAASNLEYVYPSEIFPTEVRATALGFATAISRVGAAVSTFLLPVALEQIGSMWTMILLAVIAFIGAGVSAAWAPETKGLSLEAASRVDGGR